MADPADLELLVRPAQPGGTGVLVLAGSSGALEVDRSRLLAAHGATALALRWFGGPGQQPAPYEVPLEIFIEALDRLTPYVDRLTVLGSSFGAEAALLTACHDPRVTGVVALAPTPVVWAGVAPEGRVTSHWTRHGAPVPFVAFDEAWEPDTDPPAYVGQYRASLLTHRRMVPAATIPVEQTAAELVLVGGEDDQVWPGADFARALATRRHEGGAPTTVLTHPDAGHRVVLPGESPLERGLSMARGGTPEADEALGRLAWPHVVRVLGLRE
ncbi:MAG: hypothetical protein LH468_01775 [Nocardioides sp.]|nr:hypothetical protein [Nocardioides sp.]